MTAYLPHYTPAPAYPALAQVPAVAPAVAAAAALAAPPTVNASCETPPPAGCSSTGRCE